MKFDIARVPEIKKQPSKDDREIYSGVIENTGKTLTITFFSRRVNVEVDGEIVFSTTELDGKNRLSPADIYYLSDEIDVILAENAFLHCPDCGYELKSVHSSLKG